MSVYVDLFFSGLLQSICKYVSVGIMQGFKGLFDQL